MHLGDQKGEPSSFFPSVKPLTAKGEKKKAKKKASKKRAKAKKRANAGAGASATSASAADTDTDDSDDDDGGNEEPDDNLVDSRNAPILDLMLEQLGLKTDESH